MAKAKGVLSSNIQRAFKKNGVKSRAELYNLYASRVGCTYLGDENIGSQDLADWKCSEGHVFRCKPNNIQQGKGCSYCNSNDIKYVLFRSNCKTVDEYGHELAKENPNDIKYIGGFVGTFKKAEWECSDGHRWEATPNDIKGGSGCAYCNCTDLKYVLFRNNCKTPDEYGHKIAKENTNDIKYVGGYIKDSMKAEWECSKGHRWRAVPNSIKQGTGCPYCNGKNNIKYVLFRSNCKTVAEYGHILAKENPNDIKYIGGFVGSKIKAEWGCGKGHRWEAIPNIIQQGSGCPECAKRISKKEKALFLEIQKVYPEAINNTRKLLKNTRYELDIYVPTLNKAIEFDGDFWHSKPDAIRRDAEKDVMCTEAGITLYRVKESDWDADKDTVIKNVLDFLKT